MPRGCSCASAPDKERTHERVYARTRDKGIACFCQSSPHGITQTIHHITQEHELSQIYTHTCICMFRYIYINVHIYAYTHINNTSGEDAERDDR